MPNGYEIACYYFPNYHVDPRNEAVHGPGWTEWELVSRAEPRFPDHRQPRVPLWGYEDESDPLIMARKIDAAADHGIDVFLFDWYFYDDGPFLERALEQGFLEAPNRDRLKFALMWANHNWMNIHPALLSTTGSQAQLLYAGSVTRQTFDALVDLVIERYFKHPCYWLVDGCPYFSIYELHTLIEGLGGIEPTRDALNSFRNRVKAAGFPDLHLNDVAWDLPLLPGETAVVNSQQLLEALGFNSLTSYVWIHHVPLPIFPETPYRYVMDNAIIDWQQTRESFTLPYYPNVTMGWDSSPRTLQSDRFLNAGYPFMPTLSENTPQAFQQALVEVKQFLDQQDNQRIFTINAWNEWTEGSYLEPDTVDGMAYLEAIRTVFGQATQ
jgi:hypothetical protein